jgi:light-independent protochlorophyllide reductase subunit N
MSKVDLNKETGTREVVCGLNSIFWLPRQMADAIFIVLV